MTPLDFQAVVAHGDMDCTLRGKRGTYSLGKALLTRLVGGGVARLCVAGVALGDMDCHFAWQAWHLQNIIEHIHLCFGSFVICHVDWAVALSCSRALGSWSFL